MDFLECKEIHEFAWKHHSCKSVGSHAAETFTRGALDMAHHQRDIPLGIAIKRGSLRADLADIFMILLAMRFLPQTHRVTIVNAGPDDIFRAGFQSIRIGKLSATIRIMPNSG